MFLNLTETSITGQMDDLVRLNSLKTLGLKDVTVNGDLDALSVLPSLTEVTVENCAGIEGNGEQLNHQLNGGLVFQARAESVTDADVLGRYSGNYKNNSGMMNMVIEIVSIDEQNHAVVNFEFEPIDGNEQGKSGKYRLTGSFNPNTGDITLMPERWLTAQPAGYEMLAIEGTVDGRLFKGKLDREYLPYFTAEKK